MGLFDSWLGRSTEKEQQPKIKFGRYSDSYKKDKQYDAWHQALEKFDEGDHFEAYSDFFDYLSDPEEENVNYQCLGDTHFSFEFYQGSKKIKGYSDGRKFRAEAKVVKVDQTNVGFMRRLIEKNFTLQYSRFSFDENNDVAIIFDTYLLDGSPHKLYFALQELALNADKLDDLLVNEFDMLHPIETEHIKDCDEHEKEVKYQFIQQNINRVLLNINNGSLNPKLYAQAIGYQLLSLIYKLDYLIKPEGFMMETFEIINRDYFIQDDRSVFEKNRDFIKRIQHLKDRSKEDSYKEMYSTLCTFGVTKVVDHDRLAGFIDEIIKESDWYLKNKHYEIVLSLMNYVVGFVLFSWAVPRPDRELLHLYYEIIENQYFKDLNFTFNYYNEEENKFDKSAIKKEINDIIKSNKQKFKGLSVDTTLLVFNSKHEFAISFLEMIKKMIIYPMD